MIGELTPRALPGHAGGNQPESARRGTKVRAQVVAIATALLLTTAGTVSRAEEETPASQPATAPSSQPTAPPASGPVDAPSTQPAAAPTSLPVGPVPPPDRSSGVAIEEGMGASHYLLWVPRVVLYVPRRALELAFAPIRAGSYAWERFRIPDRFKEVFFNDTGTFGVFPVAFVDTGFGLNAGVRLIHRDMFGRGESMLLRASFGGMYQQYYSAAADTGARLGRVKLRLVGGYEVGPQAPFFGIGNGDLVPRESIDTSDPDQRIDPMTDATAVSTKFRKDLAFSKLSFIARLTRSISATLSTELRYQSFDEEADEADIADYYRIDRLACLERGSLDLYPQIRLTYDSREVAHPYISQAISSRGLYLNGWLGYAKGFQDDPSNHLRYAMDLQWFVDIFRGDRVLILRVVLDGVTADLDKIPITDLPRLGGALLLRGYDIDRFRDRVATVGSAEYQYNLSQQTTAYLFVDTGRVWRALRDFRLKGFRMGYGGGIILHSASSFLARVQLASSIDGGFFVNFSLDPVYDPRAKEEQK
jgi:hypothetical protein